MSEHLEDAACAPHGQTQRLPYAAPLLVALDHNATAFGFGPASDAGYSGTASSPVPTGS